MIYYYNKIVFLNCTNMTYVGSNSLKNIYKKHWYLETLMKMMVAFVNIKKKITCS